MAALNGHGKVAAAGFTLVETLIAFAILAVSLVAVYQALSGGMISSRRAPGVALLALEAQSLSERLGTDIPLNASENPLHIELDGKWTVYVEVVDGDGPARSDLDEWSLYRLRLIGRAKDGARIEFKTLRLSR